MYFGEILASKPFFQDHNFGIGGVKARQRMESGIWNLESYSTSSATAASAWCERRARRTKDTHYHREISTYYLPYLWQTESSKAISPPNLVVQLIHVIIEVKLKAN